MHRVTLRVGSDGTQEQPADGSAPSWTFGHARSSVRVTIISRRVTIGISMSAPTRGEPPVPAGPRAQGAGGRRRIRRRGRVRPVFDRLPPELTVSIRSTSTSTELPADVIARMAAAPIPTSPTLRSPQVRPVVPSDLAGLDPERLTSSSRHSLDLVWCARSSRGCRRPRLEVLPARAPLAVGERCSTDGQHHDSTRSRGGDRMALSTTPGSGWNHPRHEHRDQVHPLAALDLGGSRSTGGRPPLGRSPRQRGSRW